MSLHALLLCAALAQGDLTLIDGATRPLPHLGTTLVDRRFLDPATGAIVRRTVDASGRAVDGDALLFAEVRARDEATGRISHELAERLAQGDELEVAFWLRRPAGHPDLREVLDAALARGLSPEDARREALAAAALWIQRVTGPFAAMLRAQGRQPSYVDAYVPLVFVRLPADAVPALAGREEVDQAYYSFPESYPEANQFASPTARTDVVHRRGFRGAGVRVMVNDPGAVSRVNPFLPPVVSRTSGSATSHATAVAGIIASTHTEQTGAAPGLAEIYDGAGSGDSGAIQAWNWGMAQGISFGNSSWWNGNKGTIVMLDRYFDYIIRNFAVMLFKSVGNQGGSDGLTTSPGNGFNCIASGSFEDRRNHDWNDDRMASYSSWVNPQPGHHKPEVAASGSSITTTTTSSPWISAAGSGTSYATPVTCGTAALLASTRDELKARPEAIKALIMAGAWHNIEGDARLSLRDGAGGVVASASHSAVVNRQYLSTTLTPASFDAGGVYAVPVQLLAGDETRIVAVWFSEADASYANTVVRMDLDMTVERPGGGVVASSASALNAWEIVQFVPPVTGTYQVRMHRQRFLGTSEPFALAWTTRMDAATNLVTLLDPPSPGGRVRVEFFDRYNPGRTYVGVASLSTLPSTLRASHNRILPVGYDVLTEISLLGAFPGFVGVLPANGRGMGEIPIPNDPAMVNLRAFLAMVTLDNAVLGLVKDTSDATEFTVR